MKISLNWLKEYVDVDVPLRELLDRLTGADRGHDSIGFVYSILGIRRSTDLPTISRRE